MPRGRLVTVAALYVDPNGVYANLPDVEVWDEARDARLYAGPWPVVAHPPCNRWSRLATFRRQRDGEDGGCFEAALAAVRRYGGVLEHPAYSLAWQRFGLARPARIGWTTTLFDPGWTCEVDQRQYGHEARKPTWLYYIGPQPPPIVWGKGEASPLTIQASYGGGARRQARRSAIPPVFRDVLLGMARSARAVAA
jgi:hypothetical protein